MKRLKVCAITLAVLSCAFITAGNVYVKSRAVEPVAVAIERVEAAVADTKEVQTV